MYTYPPTQVEQSYVVAEAIVQVLAKKVLVIYPSRFDILTVSCIVNLMQFFVVYAANKTI